MKRLFVVYGCDANDSGGGYGEEVHVVFADNKEEANNIVGVEGLKVQEVIDDGTTRIAFEDHYYE